ncbi:hypothetical protein LCGC14_2162040 [marine sediment metagenome]|uniref:Uncharacterized protein n=1 Tax=marine sediment metagenome TaxID=412755 RepID=A0A0F9GNM0_9ZZZZ
MTIIATDPKNKAALTHFVCVGEIRSNNRDAMEWHFSFNYDPERYRDSASYEANINAVTSTHWTFIPVEKRREQLISRGAKRLLTIAGEISPEPIDAEERKRRYACLRDQLDSEITAAGLTDDAIARSASVEVLDSIIKTRQLLHAFVLAAQQKVCE